MKVEMWRAYQAGQNQQLRGTATTGQKVDSEDAGDEKMEEREMELDTVLFGQPGSVRHKAQYHTLETLLEGMEKAAGVMEMEAEAAEREASVLVEEIRETIGALSDLRYGTFARVSDTNGDIGQEVEKALSRLKEVCDDGT